PLHHAHGVLPPEPDARAVPALRHAGRLAHGAVLGERVAVVAHHPLSAGLRPHRTGRIMVDQRRIPLDWLISGATITPAAEAAATRTQRPPARPGGLRAPPGVACASACPGYRSFSRRQATSRGRVRVRRLLQDDFSLTNTWMSS